MKKKAQEPVELGGVRYVAVLEGSLEHDLHYSRLCATAGLDQVRLGEGEAPQDFASRIATQLISAGIVLEMLGTLLVPEMRASEPWTPQVAKETAAAIGAITDPEEKRTIQLLVVQLVLDFFVRGMSSSPTSQRSSEGARPAKPGDHHPLASVETVTATGAA